jgi:hypothetical protein
MKKFINFIEEKGEAVDATDMPKLQQLIRLGLADSKDLALIKRTIMKMDSGEELTMKEKKMAEKLAKILLDKVIGNKVIYNLVRQGLGKESVQEDLDENARRDAMAAIRRDKDFRDKDDEDDVATDADRAAAKKNPIMQLRKISDIEGGEMEFTNRKKMKVSKVDADKILRAFGTIQKSLDKQKFQTLIGRSPEDFKKILKILR